MAALIRGVAGVVFDMDGTLIDSESHVETVVDALFHARGLPTPKLDHSALFGITWDAIAQRLVDAAPQLEVEAVSQELQDRFGRILLEGNTPLVPGAAEFLVGCCSRLPTAICTSGIRPSLDYLLDRLDLRGRLQALVTAEDVDHSKPHPQGYVLAADRLGIAPERCLAFEDSVAGLEAARAAGMATVAITHCCPDTSRVEGLADQTIADFTALPADFLSSVMQD